MHAQREAVDYWLRQSEREGDGRARKLRAAAEKEELLRQMEQRFRGFDPDVCETRGFSEHRHLFPLPFLRADRSYLF
ncbi:hypothetical protein DIPPA_09691 [Diplonema papillatum]|nr:hypothetical protein DIPPA_09691 [Diplonema papillatum]